MKPSRENGLKSVCRNAGRFLTGHFYKKTQDKDLYGSKAETNLLITLYQDSRSWKGSFQLFSGFSHESISTTGDERVT